MAALPLWEHRQRVRVAMILQRHFRGRKGRHSYWERKREHAAGILQRVQRGNVARAEFEALRREATALIVQATWRCQLGKRVLSHLRREKAAIAIQKGARGLAARMHCLRIRCAILITIHSTDDTIRRRSILGNICGRSLRYRWSLQLS